MRQTRIFLMLCVVAAFLFISGCAISQPGETGYHKIFTTFSDKNGLLYSQDGALRFLDYKSKKSVFICGKPECTHTDRSVCAAYAYRKYPFILDKNLYYFDQKSEFDSNGQLLSVTSLKQSDITGTNVRTLCEIDGEITDYRTAFLYDGKLYFFLDRAEYVNREATGRLSISCYCYDFRSAKASPLTEVVSGYYASVRGMGINDDKLYLNSSYFKENRDVLANITVGDTFVENMLCISLNGGETSVFDKPAPLVISGDTYVYAHNGKTFAYSLTDGTEKLLSDTELALFGVSGELLFLSSYTESEGYSTYLYDLNEQKFDLISGLSAVSIQILGDDSKCYYGYITDTSRPDVNMALGYILKADYLNGYSERYTLCDLSGL